MLTLTPKTPTPGAVPTRQDHVWVEFAHAKAQDAFPSRKPHRLCKRCGVVCRPDTEHAPCDPGAATKVNKPC